MPSKGLPCVFCKVGGLADWYIWWVQVNEIIWFHEFQRVLEITRLYDRMPERGFCTRHYLESQYPYLADALALVKEDVDLMPKNLRPLAEKLEAFLEAYGTHEVIGRKTRVE